jgi:hypothetical protein
MWTYLKRNSGGDWLPGEKEKLPPDGTAYLAFDSLRWKVVLGYTERGGFSSILTTNVTDDCNVIAFAPLSETTDPDLGQIAASCPWTGPAYQGDEDVKLLRGI